MTGFIVLEVIMYEMKNDASRIGIIASMIDFGRER